MNLKDRTTWIKSKVSMKTFFDHVGVGYQDISIPHQIRCPFHGVDIHASARFFPQQNEGSGSFWCWACNDGGDLLWFVEAWHGLDNVIKTCEFIEKEFNLVWAQDDFVKEFYKSKHKFDEVPTQQALIESLLLYFEVEACGKTHKNDPDINNEPWISSFREKCSQTSLPEFMFAELALWVDFDRLSDQLPQGTYQTAVQSLEEWRATHKSILMEVAEWLVVEGGGTKPGL